MTVFLLICFIVSSAALDCYVGETNDVHLESGFQLCYVGTVLFGARRKIYGGSKRKMELNPSFNNCWRILTKSDEKAIACHCETNLCNPEN
ncbi:hypothetical protein GCK72_025262 [Caenorhabditis remanei]|nr:hypothetical protein GCK72_025262 [Caenorhabditis remanei]KAF1748795.1 hypothetical protein GCK72_025262 [Caenorhabditis remanei]